jgi:hypothetical protein
MMFPKRPVWAGPRDYKNSRERAHGYTWDSRLELRLFEYLSQLPETKDLIVKPRVKLTKAEVGMIPDFKAFHSDYKLPLCGARVRDCWIFHEAKGAELEPWLIKKKLWAWYGPAILIVWKGWAKKDGTSSLKVVEEIVPPGVHFTSSC